ncbi:MAG: hypothetical protein WCH96_01725 [Betaproteobacteria bacterium]
MRLDSYRLLLLVPAIRSTLGASLLARLPVGMGGFAILLFVQQESASFAVAGMASALYVLGLASVAPFLGRMMDRAGPVLLLKLSAIIYPLWMLGLVALLEKRAPIFWIGVCSFGAGASLPQVTLCMRTLYPRVLAEASLLQTAYAIDSVLIESVFVLGPAFVSIFLAADFIAGAIWMAAISAALGTMWFIRTPMIRDWSVRGTQRKASVVRVLKEPGIIKLLLATFLYSAGFGFYEMGVTHFTNGLARPAMAGFALALASVGSGLGAIAYGARSWSWPLRQQFLLALILMAIGFVGLGVMMQMPESYFYLFMAANVLAGAPMASVIATQSQLLSRLAPEGMLAESFTWGGTALLVGISVGLQVGGWMAQSLSPLSILLAGGLGPVGAALCVLWISPIEKLNVAGNHYEA